MPNWFTWDRTRMRRRLVRLVRLLSRPNTYVLIFLVAVVMTALGAALVWYFEMSRGGDPGLRDFEGAVTYMAQNVTGVSIGARTPLTRSARVVSIVFATLAAGLRGVFVATIVSTFVNRFFLEGRGLGEIKLKEHVVICGYNNQVKQLVEVLEREAFGAGVPIVLLAEIKDNPLPNHSIHFVSGDPSSGRDLERAGIRSARSAVIVSDFSQGPHSDSTLDARSVLTALAVAAINPALYTIAEVRDPANRPHFENAHVEELVVSAEMSEGLLARAAVNHGLAKVFADLLRLDTPAEMYVLPTPPGLKGHNFQAASIQLHLRRNAILVGVMEGARAIVCPPLDYPLDQATGLVLVGNVTSPLSQKPPAAETLDVNREE